MVFVNISYTMEKHEVGRKSSQTVKVVIENHENAMKKIKLMVPSHYTAGQLANVLRSRMHILPHHPVYLFLKSKQSPVLMSKSIGLLHHKHRDEKGLLRLIHAGQTSFGFRGNIRAIRFRQKWLESHSNTLHPEAGGPPSYSGGPPPYFPLETPAANLGSALDVDETNDAYISDDLLELPPMMPIDFYIASNETNSEHSSILSFSPVTSSMTNSSSNVTEVWESPNWDDPWLSSSLADPWLPAASTNQGQTSGTPDPSQFYSAMEEHNEFTFNALNELCHISTGGSSSTAPDASNLSANSQFPNAPNPLAFLPPNLHITLYESDSDFYDSDN